MKKNTNTLPLETIVEVVNPKTKKKREMTYKKALELKESHGFIIFQLGFSQF